MKNLFRGALGIAFLGLAFGCSGGAALAVNTQNVGVCDPKAPVNCLKPQADGSMNINGSFSATVGGFQYNGNTAQIASVTTSSSRVALPAGAAIEIFNAGTSRVHIRLGDVTVTSAGTDVAIEPGSTRCSLTVGYTYLAALTDSNTSAVQIYGGSGLCNDSGGGGSTGGGGGNVNVTQIAGNSVAVGNGVTTTGTQRVTLSNDSTGRVNLAPGSTVGIDQVTTNANNVVVGGGTVDTSGSTVTALVNDGFGNNITSTGGSLDVNVKSTTGSGLATSALQTTGNTSLGTIVTNTTSLATAAAQTTGNGSLGTIVTNTGTANTTLSSISSNQATAANQTAVTGSKAGGTAAASSQLTGGVYNTAAPTLTNGQQAASQFDVNGNLKVNVISGGGSNASVGTVGAATPSSATAMGVKDGSGNLQIPSSTNPIPVTGGVAQASTTSGQTISAIGCRTLSSSPTDTTATTNMPVCGTNGGFNVNIVSGGGSGGTASSFAAAFPATGTAMGLKNGSNMVNGTADGSGNMNVNVAAGTVAVAGITGTVALPTGAATAAKQPALGTAGSASTDVITVQGIASGVAQTVSGTVSANQSGTWTVQPGNTANTTPWLASNNDGTNTQKVLAASTSAALADKAAVVSLSPNPTPVCTSTIAVNQTTSTDLKTFTNFGHICSIVLVSASAQNISLTEGTGSVCATGAAAIIGGTTASMALAANGGFSAVSDRVIIKLGTTADHMCLLQSSTGNVSGFITYQDHA